MSNNRTAYRGLLSGMTASIVLAVVVIYALYQVRTLFAPVLTGLLTAYLLYPIVSHGRRFGVPRWASTLLILLVLGGALAYLGIRVLPAIQQIIQRATDTEVQADAPESPSPESPPAVESPPPDTANDTDARTAPEASPPPPDTADDSGAGPPPPVGPDHATSKLLEAIRALGNAGRRLGIVQGDEWENQQIVDFMVRHVAESGARLLGTIGNLAIRGGQFLMIFFFVLVFVLLDGDRMYRSLIKTLPNSLFEPGLFVLHKTEQIFGYYLRGVCVESLILGIIAFVLLVTISAFTEMSFALALFIALIIAVTNVVRIVGPIVGGAIGMLLVLFSSADLWAVAGVGVVAIIVQVLDGMVVLPLVMQEQLKIHPLVSVLAIIIGGMLGGVLGMILAIPIIAGVRSLHQVVVVEMRRFIFTEGY